MNKAVRYVAEPTHVREVSLLGMADLTFWADRLRGEGLRPAERDGRAQIMIIAAEMAFMGLRFSEVSFSVLVSMPERPAQEAAFLIQAFNSRRLFVFFERRVFATPYSHADCKVFLSSSASIRIRSSGEAVFLAEMSSQRQPSRSGEEGWEGSDLSAEEGARERGGCPLVLRADPGTYSGLPVRGRGCRIHQASSGEWGAPGPARFGILQCRVEGAG